MSTGITAQGGTDRLNRMLKLYHSTRAEILSVAGGGPTALILFSALMTTRAGRPRDSRWGAGAKRDKNAPAFDRGGWQNWQRSKTNSIETGCRPRGGTG